MVEDTRNTRTPDSNVKKIEDGSEGPFKVLSLSEGETLSPSTIVVHYSNDATAEVVLDLYDASDETVEELEGHEASYILSPGEKVELTEVMMSDITNGMVADTGNNHDGTLTVNIGGGRVT